MNDTSPALWLEVVRLCVWLIALVALFAPLEHFFAVYPHRFLRTQFFTDLGYYFLNSLLPTVLLGVPIGVLAWWTQRFIPAGFRETMAGLPVWARLSLGFVAGEMGYYWSHRLSHAIPFLWRFHAIHHSAEEMDFLVNTRAHPLDVAFGRLCMLIPMYLLGFAGPTTRAGTAVPVVVVLLGTTWSFFIHANLRWRFGPLEWLVSTPAFHHWHHTRSGPIDRNFASNLPALDWLFGSIYLPGEWPADYGIKEPMPPSLVDQLVHPLFPTSTPPALAAHEPSGRQAAGGTLSVALSDSLDSTAVGPN